MLKNRELLQNSKNLLAFSAGVDSTALFFLLLEHNIPFDIAIVNYHLRPAAKEEVAYAKKLAKRFNLKCYVYDAPKIEKNFEAKAREIRYNFFEQIVEQYSYTTLLTAHHLGDRFEWMLMQFCKGAGCVELSGMQNIEKRGSYTLVRPLLHLDKQELLAYLHTKDIKYFHDASNDDTKYRRNEFRHKHANPLLQQYRKGIQKSFEYLDADIDLLIDDVQIEKCNQLIYFKRSDSIRSDIKAIDNYFKSQGKVLSANERVLIQKSSESIIARKFVVWKETHYIFIAPYVAAKNLPKTLKEKFRLLQIAPKLRGYLASDAEAVVLLSLLLE